MDFQTPLNVAEYMCSLIPEGTKTVLEPTPGEGNILKFLSQYNVTAPNNFFELPFPHRFDCIVMNPPFSVKYAYGIPEGFEKMRMGLGYYILYECLKMTDHAIALTPFFTIINSEFRLKVLKDYGIKSIIALPRNTFPGTRVQCCILELHRGWINTSFKIF
jgi:hypothetical protein